QVADAAPLALPHCATMGTPRLRECRNMRNAVLALGMFAGLAAPVGAQGSWADKMFQEGTVHDFGNVPRGTQLFHRFKVTNIYAVRLDIVQVRTSCGCVTATPTKRTLESREEAYVDVIMDARKFTGP